MPKVSETITNLIINGSMVMYEDGTPVDVNFNKVVTEISHKTLMNMLKGLAKDVLVKVKEDTEAGETTLDMIPYGNSSTFSPLNLKLVLNDEEKSFIDAHNLIVKKMLSKKEAKKLIQTRYKVGDILILRGKIKDGSVRNVKEFEVKKVIWSVKSQPVNVLILKQLSGMNNNMSLNKEDCKKYHIKYEPGLQVYSMSLNFNKKKKI